MTSPIVQFVSLVKRAAQTTRLWCASCGKETPHKFTPAGSWEEYQCPICGNVQSFRVR